MFERIERREVQRLLDQGAQLVEVLPREEYDYEHIAGAIHIWLRHLDTEAPQKLDKTRPVIVYCNDYLCDMSPRAATRLTHLGFGQVYDYVPGKTDWMAAGLPREGHSAHIPNPGDLAQRDVPSEVRAEATGWFDFSHNIGRAVAIGGLGALFVPGDPSSYTTIFWVSALLTGVGAAPALGLKRRPRLVTQPGPVPCPDPTLPPSIRTDRPGGCCSIRRGRRRHGSDRPIGAGETSLSTGCAKLARRSHEIGQSKRPHVPACVERRYPSRRTLACGGGTAMSRPSTSVERFDQGPVGCTVCDVSRHRQRAEPSLVSAR